MIHNDHDHFNTDDSRRPSQATVIPDAVVDLEKRDNAGANADTEAHEDHHHSKRSERRRLAEEKLTDQTNLLPKRKVIIIFIGLAMAIALAFLDQTIVSTALPKISSDFGALTQSSYVGTAYLLTSCTFQPLYGRLSDIFGRKPMLLSAVVIFLFGSLLCGVSQSMDMLIVSRAIAGIGGGGILSISMVIVGDIVSLRDRGKYQGIIGSVVAISGAIGPLLGGVFSDKVTWRLCFFINLPLGGMAIVTIIYFLPLKHVINSFKSKLQSIDYLGIVLLTIGSIMILLPTASGGTTWPWNSPQIIICYVLGVIFFSAFIYTEWKVATLPIVPLRVFRDPSVVIIYVFTFFIGAMSQGQIYYLPLYYQAVLGKSATVSGLQLIPLLVVQSVCSWVSGIIVSWTGKYKPSIVTGFAIWTIGQGLISTLSASSTLAEQVVYMALTGAGAGQTFQTSLVALQAISARKDMAIVTSLRNFWRLMGSTLGLAAVAAIFNNRLADNLANLPLSSAQSNTLLTDATAIRDGAVNLTSTLQGQVINAYMDALHSAFLFWIPLAGICCILSLFIKQTKLEKTKKTKEPAEVAEKAAANEANLTSDPVAAEEATAKTSMTSVDEKDILRSKSSEPDKDKEPSEVSSSNTPISSAEH